MTETYDIECPYCEMDQEINHDDGYGYDEDETYNQECPYCEKIFTFTTSIVLYYDALKAPCLNGGEHKWVPVRSTARDIWPYWKRCAYCGEEDKGEVNQDGLRKFQGKETTGV